MTGTSMVKSRRLPASLSRRPIRCNLIMAWHGFDGGNDLVVGHLLGGAEKRRVAPIHEDGAVAFGIAAQGADQLPPLRVIQGSKIHRMLPSCWLERTAACRRTSRPCARLPMHQ